MNSPSKEWLSAFNHLDKHVLGIALCTERFVTDIRRLLSRHEREVADYWAGTLCGRDPLVVGPAYRYFTSVSCGYREARTTRRPRVG